MDLLNIEQINRNFQNKSIQYSFFSNSLVGIKDDYVPDCLLQF